MSFPDRIERTVEVAHPPAKVWAALTTADGLAAWFGNEATIDLRPGGSASMRWKEGHVAEMRVERVEEPTVFGFTWHNLVNACASAVASLFVRYDALAAVVLSRTGLL